MSILTVDGLCKQFQSHQVLRSLSFAVEEHSVFGFLGQNGAGKTTTMKLILGLLKADSGTMTVCGEPVHYGQTATNRLVGYLPDVPEFYSYMTPREYLRLCGRIAGLPEDTTKQRSKQLLEMVGLTKSNKRISGFSRGMKQRLGIAQALLHEPKLLICDEPTSALDPIGRKEILDILAQVRGKTTVLFSTHILSDVERICDTVAILHQGSVAMSGSLPELKARKRHTELTIRFAEAQDATRLLEAPALAPFRACMQQTEGLLVCTTPQMQALQAAVIRALADTGLLPVCMELAEPTLESLFLEVVQ